MLNSSNLTFSFFSSCLLSPVPLPCAELKERPRREKTEMKKRYLPPSPLKVAHKNMPKDSKGLLDKKENGCNHLLIDSEEQKRQRRKRWFVIISASVAVLLVVLVGVYIQKYSSICFVWQEYYYASLKNETNCIHIRDHIQKGRILSTAGFRFASFIIHPLFLYPPSPKTLYYTHITTRPRSHNVICYNIP